MKVIYWVLSFVFASAPFFFAQADVIDCSFTEPFISTSYSMAQQTLTIRDDVMEKTYVIKNVSFQIKSAGKFELVGKDKKVIMILTLNGKGSDGMSDAVYPYDVNWKNTASTNYPSGLWGGCSSNSLHAVEPKN
jgi:uncharacterized membrane protein